MTTNEFRLTTEFPPAIDAPTREKHAHSNLVISATSPCIGMASKVCNDVFTALEYGAVPEAQLVIRDRINQANRDSLPLSCALSFGS